MLVGVGRPVLDGEDEGVLLERSYAVSWVPFGVVRVAFER